MSTFWTICPILRKNIKNISVFLFDFPYLCTYINMTSMIEESYNELFYIDSENVRQKNPFSYLNQIGFLLCLKGRISLVMDERRYDIQEGDLYIYPAFSQTQVHSVSNDMQGMAGTADFNFVLSSLNYISNTRSHIYIRFHPVVSLTTEQRQRIEDIFNLTRNRLGIRTQLGAHVVSALIKAFCYEVIDAYICNESMQSMKQNRKDKTFQDFLFSLYQNFHIHRDVRFYAEQQSLTPRYFATLIHEVSGKTPLQWISMFVIIEAKHLLANPKISIKEAANKLNFTDQSFFGRYFKLYAGCSPSEYKLASLPGK